MVGGQEASPSDVRATERLRSYWIRGPGAAKVRWGQPGDFDRCVVELSRHVTDPQGLCAQLHHDALGIWPATHAKALREAHRGH